MLKSWSCVGLRGEGAHVVVVHAVLMLNNQLTYSADGF